MKIALIFLIIFSNNLWASIENAPPSYSLKRGDGSKAVFIDIKNASYKINYDVDKLQTMVTSTITFEMPEEGRPIIDLVPLIRSAKIRDEKISTNTFSPDNVSTLRYLDKLLEEGEYTVVIDHKLEKYLRYSTYNKSVRSAFWMSDLSDRRFLEQFLPTSLEYDQYSMTFEVEVAGTNINHVIKTNGKMIESEDNKWKISYPDYFTSSSIFFHLFEKGAYKENNFTYQSIDGRTINVDLYGTSYLSEYKTRTLSVLRELENDYGPWPHEGLVIYGAGSGGMEYCGATITSLRALGHELIHSYFARGVMSARGNSGWMDEAIASWRDSNYRRRTLGELEVTKMAGHSIYRRTTDRAAYTKGARFMGYLDTLFLQQGGLKKFLKSYFTERKLTPVLTSTFQDDLELFFNYDLDDLFNPFIYGKGSTESHDKIHTENPFHPELTDEDMLKLL